MDQTLKIGDQVEFTDLPGVTKSLVGQKGVVVGFPDAERVTVEVKGLLSGNFRRQALKKIQNS